MLVTLLDTRGKSLRPFTFVKIAVLLKNRLPSSKVVFIMCFPIFMVNEYIPMFSVSMNSFRCSLPPPQSTPIINYMFWPTRYIDIDRQCSSLLTASTRQIDSSCDVIAIG